MFDPSELGTKEYWDSFYETEITNFNNIGDVGEIWFGESKEKQALKFCKEVLNATNASIMDVGCGNGHLSLFLVQNLDISPIKVYAFDYSKRALELSEALLKSENLLNAINLDELDICIDIPEKWMNLVNIAIDKGTYDAISLCPDDALEKLEKYRENMYKIIQNEGYLLIFSCNWTEDELRSHFISVSNNNWIYHKTLPSISFSFGGKAGKNRTLSTLMIKSLWQLH